MSLTNSHVNRTTKEWEQVLGYQIHVLRVRKRIEQKELATLANVSVSAIKNLEGGKGSTLRTFIRVIRALERTDFLEALQPQITISPLDVIRTGKTAVPSRVVKSRKRPQQG
jgi:transcriptional regulator with XRE-family HTH domain